jgi:hypothetical protein
MYVENHNAYRIIFSERRDFTLVTKIVFFITIILIPIIMIAFSMITKKAVGKNYKKSLGLITRISRQNQKSWNMANRYANRFFGVVGIFLFAVSAVIAIICIIFNTDITTCEYIVEIAIPIQALSSIGLIAFIENRVYKKYFSIAEEKNIEPKDNNN